MSQSVEIFFCYAREDELLRQGLEKQLKALKRQGLVDLWYDCDISAGTEWEREIDRHLNTAQIILLLISPDFMDSDYCYSTEMKRAMERHERREARVIPVILRPVYWQGTSFGKLQALPTGAKPIQSSQWHNLDEAFFDVSEGIRKAVQESNARAFIQKSTSIDEKSDSATKEKVDSSSTPLPKRPTSDIDTSNTQLTFKDEVLLPQQKIESAIPSDATVPLEKISQMPQNNLNEKQVARAEETILEVSRVSKAALLNTSGTNRNFATKKLREARTPLLIILIIVLATSGLTGLRVSQNHQNNVTATANAIVNATSQAQATAKVLAANHYPPYMQGHGNLALYDALDGNNSRDMWDVSSSSTDSCQFLQTKYHVGALKEGGGPLCMNSSSQFGNFVYDVQMTILKGDCGGLVIRANNDLSKSDLYEVCQDGSYNFVSFKNNLAVIDLSLSGNSGEHPTSSAIKKGLNQRNQLTIMANGGAITMYVNNQKISSVNADVSLEGRIGLVATDLHMPTDVAYSNARVWKI